MEFLTVTAIVGILAALLLPSLNSAREKSRAVACVNNLRQLGQLAVLYSDDYAVLPPVGATGGYIIWQNTALLQYGQLLPGHDPAMARTFFCPSATSFTMSDVTTGLRSLGQPGRITASSYYTRGDNAGAPRRLDGPVVSVMADIFFAPGSARNHAGGVNVLFSDDAVRFVTLPVNWDIEQLGAWDDLDRRGL